MLSYVVRTIVFAATEAMVKEGGTYEDCETVLKRIWRAATLQIPHNPTVVDTLNAPARIGVAFDMMKDIDAALEIAVKDPECGVGTRAVALYFHLFVHTLEESASMGGDAMACLLSDLAVGLRAARDRAEIWHGAYGEKAQAEAVAS
jgi:hypothetical protein